MISIESMQGAWRIEESPQGHPLGFPHSHWLIVGERVMVIRDRIVEPRVFHARIYFEPDAPHDFFGLTGEHGGRGYATIDGDLLFVSFGIKGVRPPRFASDCGIFFAFTRDNSISLPPVETRSREPVADTLLGTLSWDRVSRDWIGAVPLATGEICDVSIRDDLRPLDMQIQVTHEALAWLSENFSRVAAACGEKVREWLVPEDEEPEASPLEHFSQSISIRRIGIDDHYTYLWASTSLPLDHSLRIWLKRDEGNQLMISDISMEG